MRLTGIISVCALMVVAASGCGGSHRGRYGDDARMRQGLILVLPGIEGPGILSESIRDGLAEAGAREAIVVYMWGAPVPLAGPLINQVDVLGNRLAARQVAKYIEGFQDRHPGAPVFLVGHSGGGGIAVFAAETLPKDHIIDGIVLLSPSLSSEYDLDKAMAHTRQGIVNFWSPNDVGLLVVGTTLLGNMDGGHGPAAGAVGFKKDTDGSQRYKLQQVEWTPAMESSGNRGTHMDSAGREFVARYVAPWIITGKTAYAERY